MKLFYPLIVHYSTSSPRLIALINGVSVTIINFKYELYTINYINNYLVIVLRKVKKQTKKI